MSESRNQKDSGNKNLELPNSSSDLSSKDESSSPIFDTPRRKHSLQSTNKINFNARSECVISSEYLGPQTPTRENESFSKDTSNEEDCSQAQSPLQETESWKITPAQKTKSPLSEFTEPTLFSQEKSISPDQHTLVISPAKRNKTVPFEKTTTDVRSPLLTSPSSSVVSLQPTSPGKAGSPKAKSPSTTVPIPLSNSPSKTIESPIAPLPSSNDETTQSTSLSSSTVQSAIATLPPSNDGSPPPISLAESPRSSSATSPSTTFRHSLSNSPSEAVGTLVSTSPSVNVQSPQSTSSTIQYFSNDTLEAVSSLQSSLKKYHSPKKSQAQKTPSSLAELTSKRVRSDEESPSKRNRSVTEEITKIFKSSLSVSPLARVQSPLETSPSSVVRSPLETSLSPNVRSPLATSPLPNVPSPFTTPPLPNVLCASATAPYPNLRALFATSPSPKGRSPLATSPSYNIRSPLATSPSHSVRSPLATSPSHNFRSPLATSPSHNVRSPLATSPSYNVRSPSATSPSTKVQSPLETSSIVGSHSISPAKSPQSPLVRFLSSKFEYSLSNSPPEADRLLVSTSPSSNVRSPDSKSSRTVQNFSNDTSEDVSTQQSSFQKTHSPKKSQAQKTQSPLARTTTKRVISYEESPSKRNRSVEKEESTKEVKSSPSVSPLPTSPCAKVRSPSPKSSSANIQSPLRESTSPLVQSSPLLSPSANVGSSQAASACQSPTSVQSLEEIFQKDAYCQVNLCCKESLKKLSLKNSPSTRSNFSDSEIFSDSTSSDKSDNSFHDFTQHFNSRYKSVSKMRNKRNKKGIVHDRYVLVEDKTQPVPKEKFPEVKTILLPEFASFLDNPQYIVELCNQRQPITKHISKGPLQGDTQRGCLNTLEGKKVVFVGTRSCGKTSMILKILNKLNHYNLFCRKSMDYSFLIRCDDQRPMMDITFQDADTSSLSTGWKSYCGSDIFVMCFAVNDYDSYWKITVDIRKDILRLNPLAPMMLVGLKSDLRDETKHTEIHSESSLVSERHLKETWKGLGFVDFIECSIYNDSFRELYESILKYFKLISF